MLKAETVPPENSPYSDLLERSYFADFLVFDWEKFDKDNLWHRELLHAIRGVMFKENMQRHLAARRTKLEVK